MFLISNCIYFINNFNGFITQDQGQVLNDTVDGKEIYNTIRRKTKDAFYKNIVKKGYLLKKGKETLKTKDLM